MQDLNAILARSSKLIKMDANGTLDAIKKQQVDEGTLSYGKEGTVDYVPSTSVRQGPLQTPTSETISANSKLPKEIIESFKSNQISNPMDTLMGGGSVLDRIKGLSPQKIRGTEQTAPKQVVTEAVENTPQTHFQPSTIDYNVVKMIVDESVKKYATALKKAIVTESKQKQTLNESASTMQAMKIGNTFTFIDNKGNLYEAKLKFIKNINEK